VVKAIVHPMPMVSGFNPAEIFTSGLVAEKFLAMQEILTGKFPNIG
jgi:hypothetical protein